jgi:hypothetical protein
MRKKISASELQLLLENEFRKTAAGLCRACSVPKPVFLRTASGGSNWRIGSLAECSGLCHTILEEVAGKLAEKYDLKS